MIDLDLFFDVLRDITMTTDFVKMALTTFVTLAFRNRMGYRYLNARVNCANDACISCENFVKFGPVTPEMIGSFVNVWYDMANNWHMSSNISEPAGPIFAIFTPYESALRFSRDVAMATK